MTTQDPVNLNIPDDHPLQEWVESDWIDTRKKYPISGKFDEYVKYDSVKMSGGKAVKNFQSSTQPLCLEADHPRKHAPSPISLVLEIIGGF